MSEPVAAAAEGYETAERTYLDAVRAGGGRAELADLAEKASTEGERWTKEAYAQFFSLREQGAPSERVSESEIQAEIAEVVTSLWRDVAAAHRGHE
jgi:hypothetical protein